MAKLRLRSFRPAQKAAPRVHTEPHLSVVPPKVDHVGLILREGREHFGADLRDVASTLRIRHVYLQAIEDGRFDELPGPTYAIGFVRAYSDFLGFDTESLLERFRAEPGALERPTELDFPTAPAEGRFPGGGALLVSLIVAGAVFGGWYYMQIQDEFRFERMPAVIADTLAGRFGGDEAPQGSVPMPGAPAEGAGDEFAAVYDARPAAPELSENPPAIAAAPELAAVPEPEPPLAVEAPPAVAMESLPAPPRLAVPAFDPEAVPVTPQAELALLAGDDPMTPEIDMAAPGPAEPATPNVVAAAPRQAAPVAPDVEIAGLPEEPEALAAVRLPAVPRSAGSATSGRVYGMTNRNSRIVIIAEVDSWIQVRDASRTDVFTRMLRAGDSYRVPNERGLILMTGNAGGLKIALDGEEGRALGTAGEVARDVPLDPDLLRTRYLR